MATICGIYGIDISKDGLKMLATAAVGTGGATLIGKSIVTNILKLIPAAGSIAGGAISAGTAGIVTLAMGKAFIKVCNLVKVGKLSEKDLTSKKGKQILSEQFREQLKNNKKEKKTDKSLVNKTERHMLNIPDNYKTSNVKQPKENKLPSGIEPYGMRTDGTSVLLTHMFVDENASMPFDNDQSIIDSLHNSLSESMGIVEVNHGTTLGGKPYVYNVLKQPRIENGDFAEHGVGYTLNLNVKEGDLIHFINASFKEDNITPSEAQKKWFMDPYDESFTRGFLRNYSEQEQYDDMFPDHPLSHLHRFIKYVVENN